MKLFLRQSCVFMLLLLQAFAPLVHAHTETVANDSRVHLHDFQSYISVESSNGMALLPELQHVDIVIALSPAIKEKNDLKDLFPSLYVQLYLWHSFQLQQLEQSIDFLALFKIRQTSFKHLVTAPRAPPSYQPL